MVQYSQEALQNHLSKVFDDLFDDFFNDLSAAQPLLGAAFAVSLEGMVVSSASGYADLTAQTALEPDAPFPIFSVIKPILAAALLILVEQGTLTLETPLAQLFPEFNLNQRVTLRRVMNHTAGLADYGALEAYSRDLKERPLFPWSASDFLLQVPPTQLMSVPGTQFAYSNIGYLLLALALERVTHESLAVALERMIFAPLGLRHTRVLQTLSDMQSLTAGYSILWSEDLWQDIRQTYPPQWVSHGLAASTAQEVVRVLQAILEGHFFGPELCRAMLEPFVLGGSHPVFPLRGYGLGWMIDASSENLSSENLKVGHGGGGPGFSVGVLHRQAGGITGTCVVWINRDGVDFGLEAADKLLGAAMAFVKKPSPDMLR
jgi:D-alanyl-D-alanine carboxypeptidase